MSRLRVAASLLAVIGLLVSAHPAVAAPPDVAEATVAAAPEVVHADLSAREVFGLEARPSGPTSWDAELGIVLTEEERDALARRQEFVERVLDTGLLDRAEAQDGFDSAYFDRAGNLHLRFAPGTVGAASRTLAERVPAGHDLGQRVEFSAAEILYDDVKQDTRRIAETAERALGLSRAVTATSIDVETMTMTVELHGEASDEDIERLRSRPWATGAPLRVRAGSYVDPDCSTRENCTGPMRSGIVIRRGSTTGSRCTMGFHVANGSQRSFLTAGHCSHGTKSNNWYHQGYGFLGSVQQTWYASSHEIDAMRVNMPNSQASNRIYNDSRRVVGITTPSQGLNVCMSKGVSASVGCGQVSSGYTSWVDTNGVRSWGYRHNMSRTGGDSGSPIYVRSNSTQARAVGLHNTSGGGFASVRTVMNLHGYTLVTS